MVERRKPSWRRRILNGKAVCDPSTFGLSSLESISNNANIGFFDVETPKDPGIPNDFPYKDQILAEVAEQRRIVRRAKFILPVPSFNTTSFCRLLRRKRKRRKRGKRHRQRLAPLLEEKR